MSKHQRTQPLNVQAETNRLLFALGAATTGLSATDSRAIERASDTAEELWQLLPFVKALVQLGAEHQSRLLGLWTEALQEPMPFGAAPIGLPPSTREDPTDGG